MQGAIKRILPDISHGDHCCLLFSSPEEQVDVTVPFLMLGLQRDEQCVYVGDDASVVRLREGLKRAGVSVEQEIARNRLLLSSGRDYLDEGRFSSEKMMAFLQQTYDTALKNGFTALRATGDVSWEVGPQLDFSNIVYYETLLDVFFLGKKMVGMCQYQRDRCPADVIGGILSTHKFAAVDKTLCDNFHYVPPELLLEKNAKVRQEKRTQWMTSQLLRVQQAEAELLKLNADLEKRVADRTAELESFSHSVSHDLRAPIRSILGFSQAIIEDFPESLEAGIMAHLTRVVESAKKMDRMVEGFLKLARLSRKVPAKEEVDLSALSSEIVAELKRTAPDRKVMLSIAGDLKAKGDPELLRAVLTNLISNAWKFTSKKADARIEIGRKDSAYYVKDNGSGFESNAAGKLFSPFQRLHGEKEFEGTGIGLATVQRIIARHGGRVWAEGEPDRGATFFFSLDTRKD